MRVRFTLRARRDLEAIIDYLVDENPQGARNVGRALDSTIHLI
jgi:plasmid stabilization system protein ParE